MIYKYTCFDFENRVLLEWEKYAGDMDPYKIDVSPVKNYIVFKDHCGHLNLINKVSGVKFSFSQRDTDGKYCFYKDGCLINRTENFEEIEFIIIQILREEVSR